MAKNVQSFKDAVMSSVTNADPQKLKDAVDSIASYCYKDPCSSDKFDETIFSFILELFANEKFLTMEGAYSLLLIFEYDWASLALNQKQRLRTAIERTYCRFTDWMSCFVLTELLGEYYSDEAAFEILFKLKNSPVTGAHRTLLPMGFGQLARNTKDAALKGKSISELTKLAHDSSDEVQKEAREALDKIAAVVSESRN
jgi:hypothetical protein